MTAQGKLAAAWTWAGFGEKAYQQRLAQMGVQPGGEWVTTPREPLSASQHILHLLLTVLTGGLWGIVWIIRAVQGNQRRVWQQPPTAAPGVSGARPRPL